MKNQNLALKIKELRTRKGFSQEQLSEESKLSLRTIQRIEKGDTIPRGDTLVKLTLALGVTPDDLLDWEMAEDRTYLQLMNWSALSFIIQPFLGIIIPLVMWIFKREKINRVDDAGKQIINFQITWALVFYTVLSILIMIIEGEFYFPARFSIQHSISSLVAHFSAPSILIFSFYVFNIGMILFNVRQSQRAGQHHYFPAIPFLR